MAWDSRKLNPHERRKVLLAGHQSRQPPDACIDINTREGVVISLQRRHNFYYGLDGSSLTHLSSTYTFTVSPPRALTMPMLVENWENILRVPDTMSAWPWPRKLNPSYEEIETKSKAWLSSFKPYLTPESQNAHNKCSVGLLAAHVWGSAPCGTSSPLLADAPFPMRC